MISFLLLLFNIHYTIAPNHGMYIINTFYSNITEFIYANLISYHNLNYLIKNDSIIEAGTSLKATISLTCFIILSIITILLIIFMHLKKKFSKKIEQRFKKIIVEKTYQLKKTNEEIVRINVALTAEKELLKTILESIEDGVISVDSEGKIVFTNKSMQNILEIEEKKLIGEKLYEIMKTIIDDDSSEFLKCFNTYCDNICKLNNKQIIINTSNGNRKILNVRSNKLETNSNEIGGVVFTFKDKTELINIETQLTLSQKLESIGQLAAGVAHEINTPLQYVGDNVKFLDTAFYSLNEYITKINNLLININDKKIKDEIDETQKVLDLKYLLEEIPEAIEQTHIGIQRVSQIITSMRDFAHPPVKSKSLHNINHSIEVTTNICRNRWKYIADLKMDLDPYLPNIFCCIDEINQVILNMLLNSIDAIEEKIEKLHVDKGVITITTKKIGYEIEISISDTGIGIKKENLRKIFDPFFTTKQVGKGTGQGLSICYNIIVNKHHGKIFVDSEYGVGTTFTIRLPINTEGNINAN